MSQKYSVIIVDDELSALKGLEKKINKNCPELEILDTFQSPTDALMKLKNTVPDILFLDIHMPKMNGFELLEALGNVQIQVIFCTAFNEYALEAIKKSAVDYILKPIANEELKGAVQKAILNINQKKERVSEDIKKLLNKVLDRDLKISIPTQKGMCFIPQEEVLHLEGYEGYTRIHLVNGTTIISSYSLGKFDGALNNNFFKCHKSHIVNLTNVRGFENEGYIMLSEDYRVPISRTYKQVFLELFKK